VIPWEKLATGRAPDGQPLELRRRGHEYLIYAGGYDLMSSEDDVSSKALGELGCAHLQGRKHARVLVGGLGMGYTLRAALDAVSDSCQVEVAELVGCVADWNRKWLADLAGHPLDDPRTTLLLEDVRAPIHRSKATSTKKKYDAILLDVDNGPDALAHKSNDGLYGKAGLERAFAAIAPGGVFALWSFGDDAAFTRRLSRVGFIVATHKISASKKGRGRYHQIWTARKPA